MHSKRIPQGNSRIYIALGILRNHNNNQVNRHMMPRNTNPWKSETAEFQGWVGLNRGSSLPWENRRSAQTTQQTDQFLGAFALDTWRKCLIIKSSSRGERSNNRAACSMASRENVCRSESHWMAFLRFSFLGGCELWFI